MGDEMMAEEKGIGQVWLVGAGPGDEGLLTLRGCDCLKRADAVVFDRLVGPGVLSLIPAKAEKIDVGKTSGTHPVPQERIQQIMLDLAREGKNVVRLKGGDPFLFGRGGEEMDWLEKQGVPCLMVPGVSSALAGPAYAGIPVTDRGTASSVHIVTAHAKSGSDSVPDWQLLAKCGGTLVLMMGLARLRQIVAGLTMAGKAPQTPAAVIENGTCSRQRVVRGPLADIAALAEREHLAPPALIVVGPAAAMALNWTRRLPLFGRLVVVTRTAETAGKLSAQLRRLGAEVVEFPTIALSADFSDPRLASLDFSRFGWLAFTSPRGVQYFLQWLREQKRDIRSLGGLKLAALGSATARALEDLGLRVDLVPDVYSGKRLGEELARRAGGERVLLLRALKGGGELPQALKAAGCQFEDLPLYRTEPAAGDRKLLLDLLERGEVDYVTFTSASTVTGFRDAVGDGRRGFKGLCIGPSTARAAAEAGFSTVISPQASLEAMVKTLLQDVSAGAAIALSVPFPRFGAKTVCLKRSNF